MKLIFTSQLTAEWLLNFEIRTDNFDISHVFHDERERENQLNSPPEIGYIL